MIEKEDGLLEIEFEATIRDIRYQIDTVGDKVAKMTIEFYATIENQDAINRLQQPEENVMVRMCRKG
jgi:NAD-dependent DNA ligase